MSVYASQGTVRVSCTVCFDASGKAIRKATVFFIPDKDYSVKDRNKNYAVFVPQSCGCSEQSCGCSEQSCGCSEQSCGCKPYPYKNAIIRKYCPNEGIEIEMHAAAGKDCINIVSTAAMKKLKVRVKVRAALKKKAIAKILTAAEAAACQVKGAGNACETAKATEAAKLVKVVHKSNHCLELTGIEIPAQ